MKNFLISGAKGTFCAALILAATRRPWLLKVSFIER